MTRIAKRYLAKDGRSWFRFVFVQDGGRVDIYCRTRPPLTRDPGVATTHVYQSGRICFVAGREPRTQSEAERLVKTWAEYYLTLT